MKKLYFLAFLLSSVFSGRAQYSLTSANNHVTGDSGGVFAADTTGVLTGTSGTGQLWNYTGLAITPGAGTTNTYIPVTDAPNAASFPSATIAQTDDSGANSYYMLDYSSSAVTFYGYTASNTAVVYSNPETIYTMPLTYGSACSDTYAGSYTVSGSPVNITGTVTTTGVGTGTLSMPGGLTYSNVLQVKVLSRNVTSAPTLSYLSTQDLISYIYYSAFSKDPVLTVAVSTVATTGSATSYAKSVTLNRDLQETVGIHDYQKDAGFRLYPNPADHSEVSLYFVLAQEENYTMTIYNAIGQAVQARSFGKRGAGIYNEAVDLSGLAGGMYYIRLKGARADGIQKLVIQ